MGLRTFVRSAIAWELRFQLMQRPRLSHKIEIPHSNQLCNRFIPPSVQKTCPKSRQHLIRGKQVLNSNETQSFRFHIEWSNKVQATFTNITASKQVKSSIQENPYQNPENIDRSKIADSSLSVFASQVCGKTKYEQLVRTELRPNKSNQVFTNILSKIQKTLIGAKQHLDLIETKFFRFHYMW